MVSLCVDNANRAGAHVEMTHEAVTSAKRKGDRMVITVSMPYNKAGSYMGHCYTHAVTTHRATMYSLQVIDTDTVSE